MSVSFDWDFQDSKESFSEGPGGSRVPPDWRSRLRWVVVAAVLLLAVGVAVRAWASRRLGNVHEAEDKLREVVELELRNIRQGDAELLGLIQDPADSQWRERQLARYVSGDNWGFAPAPGLVLASRKPTIEQARVLGRNARVELTLWFQTAPSIARAQVPNGVSPWLARLFPLLQSLPLPFDVTWFYRLDENGAWYHTAPPNDYVGAPYSWHGTWLDVHAHEAETQVLEEDVDDLFLFMLHACRLLNCPGYKHYDVCFKDAPRPLVSACWMLPSLYLTGQPDDAIARAAWLHAVKLWLVERLVGDLLSRGGKLDLFGYRYLVARAQAELGLLQRPQPDVEILRQAMVKGELHSLWSLWEAVYDADDVQQELLQAEAAALFQLIEAQVGTERFFESLPTLDAHVRLSDALMDLYGLGHDEFVAFWHAHLSSLTGVDPALAPISDAQVELSISRVVEPPPPDRSIVIPGNQIAIRYGDQILVSNLDGSGIVPLITDGYHFGSPLWSPDGRWLLSVWQGKTAESGFVYLLTADGRQLRFLSPELTNLWLFGWSPDGRRVYFWSETSDEQAGAGFWTVDVETGQSSLVPVWRPVLSPDGRRVVYDDLAHENMTNSLWLAEINEQAALDKEWENVRKLGLGDGVEAIEISWSPDSAALALVLRAGRADPQEYGVFIYDLETESLLSLFDLSDLKDAVRSSEGDLLTGDVDLAILETRSLRTLSIWGWSADGRHLLVRAVGADGLDVVNFIVPLDGSLARVLAFGGPGSPRHAAWSPTAPNLLAFVRPLVFNSDLSRGYLIDLESGPIYTTTQAARATWSPDGEWLAFDGSGHLMAVSREGQVRSVLRHGGGSIQAWNPSADLTPPKAECSDGLDLWLGERDVYRFGSSLVVVVRNKGKQAAQDVQLRFTSGGDEEVELSYYLDSSVDYVVPPCGSLMLRVSVASAPGGLTVSVNPPDEPGALPELDYENNRVTVEKPDF